VDGVRQVAGITSGGTKEVFGDRSYDTRVDAIADWIDQMLNPSAFMLTSGPLAVRNPALPGEPVAFSAEVNAPDVTWAWDFGDGSPSDPTAPTIFFPETLSLRRRSPACLATTEAIPSFPGIKKLNAVSFDFDLAEARSPLRRARRRRAAEKG